MKRSTVAVVLCLGCFALAVAMAVESLSPAPAKLTFPASGFSILPLDEGGKKTHQVLMMFLPATEAFAPNVNVQRQIYAGTRDKYAEISRGQFKQMGGELLDERTPDARTLLFEYRFKSGNRTLHAYSKAVLANGCVTLATAVATESQWKETGAKLKACVNSLELLAPQGESR